MRAIGPLLTAFGVAGALQDPTLDLYDNLGNLIVSNNDWKETQETEITATGLAPTNNKESAILMTLGPGAYTAIVRGQGNTTGVAWWKSTTSTSRKSPTDGAPVPRGFSQQAAEIAFQVLLSGVRAWRVLSPAARAQILLFGDLVFPVSRRFL